MFRGCWGLDLEWAVGEETYTEPLSLTDMVRDTSVFRTGYASRRADITANEASKLLVPRRYPGGAGAGRGYNGTGKIWCSWGMRVSDSTPAKVVYTIWKLYLGNGTTDNDYIELRLLTDGQFQLRSSFSGENASGAAGLAANTWHSIWVEYDHNTDDSDPPGSGNAGAKVYVDGNEIINYTFIQPTDEFIHYFYFNPLAAKDENPSVQIWFDDVWCNDDEAGDITTEPSKTAYAIRPFWPVSGAPTYDEWVGDYADVDDVAYSSAGHDGDTTDTNTDQSSEKQTHEMVDCGAAGVGAEDSIYGVMQMSLLAPVAPGDDGKFSVLMRADGADEAVVFDRSAGGPNDWYTFYIPAGNTPAGNPWTQDLVNSMECGCQTEADVAETYKCTAVYAYVATDTIGAGPSAGRRFGSVPTSELVPNDFGADERRFGAVPSDETVAEDFGADERRFGAVPTDESVPDDLT